MHLGDTRVSLAELGIEDRCDGAAAMAVGNTTFFFGRDCPALWILSLDPLADVVHAGPSEGRRPLDLIWGQEGPGSNPAGATIRGAARCISEPIGPPNFRWFLSQA